MVKQTIAELSDIFASNVLNESIIKPFAGSLGLSVQSLRKLGIGINPSTGAYTFSERDDQGNVIGIMQRFPDGKKMMVTGSKRGLTYEVNPNFFKDENRYEPGKHNWVRLYEAKVSCPICGKSDWCLVSASNPSNPSAVLCARISEGAIATVKDCGFLHILRPDGQILRGSRELLPSTTLPIIIVEGASDTATAMDLSFVAVGRPSAEGKLNLLPNLVRGKDVIIVGDNDAGAGKKGMDAVFYQLKSVCKKLVKVLPPSQFKDLRQWKNQVSLTQEQFLQWVLDNGDIGGNPDVLDDDVAHTIAKKWLEQERTQDGLPTIRCYKSQWIQYEDGYYRECNTEEFRGSIYHFLEGKTFSRTNAKGGVDLVPYKPTRAKVSDIIDGLTDWCSIIDDPPVWLRDMGCPSPENLIAFQNGILDVNEYVEGRIKLYNPTPAFFSFNILPYNFDENVHSELWEQFYKDVFNGDETKIQLLSQWFGYNCVPDMSYEKLLLCTGRPRSGKGTILNTLAALLGPNQVVSTSFQTLCTEFGYQPLLGKLAVLLSDAKVPNPREAEAALEKILQIVGRDPVGIRRMYVSYLPQVYLRCKFSIAMNDLPNLPDNVNALEPKLNILYFENSYIGREDTALKYKLQQEAAQGKLINFALEGLKSLRKEGKFIVPHSSKTLLKQLRELTTPVSSFIADCCESQPPGEQEDYYVIIDYLYDAWVKWCVERGRRPGIKEQFGRWFLSACPTAAPARIRVKNRLYRVYRKVRLAQWVMRDYLGVYK